MLPHVREEGGAYGVDAFHQQTNLVMYSYDDPNLLRTLEQFELAEKWMQKASYSEKEVEEAILTLFSSIDAPVQPEEIGFSAVLRGTTHEDRNRMRVELLESTKAKIQNLAWCCQNKNTRHVFVMGSHESIHEVEEKKSWIIDDFHMRE